MTRYAILIACLAWGTHLLHRSLDRHPLPQAASLSATLASPDALQLLALGYESLVADYYWLRSLEHFGDMKMHEHAYPNLEPYLRRVLSLDPYFKTAYFLAGTALTVQGMDHSRSNALLEQGLRYRPDVWEIPFYMGFNSYYFAHDYARAAQLLALAAKNPDAPEITGALATRLAARAGRPEVGLALVDSMLEGITDQKLRREYEDRRRLLEMERDLLVLADAVRRFETQHQRRPRNIEELVGPGLMRALPLDAFGQAYFIDDQGSVRTHSESRRLRLGGSSAPQEPGPWQ